MDAFKKKINKTKFEKKKTDFDKNYTQQIKKNWLSRLAKQKKNQIQQHQQMNNNNNNINNNTQFIYEFDVDQIAGIIIIK